MTKLRVRVLSFPVRIIWLGALKGTRGGALANHELPYQEYVDKHPFYINQISKYCCVPKSQNVPNLLLQILVLKLIT
jgi:hypothetical protein